jgi:nitroimidazol reductase NimA-like FMN-containing flavoprotein (pyridoxamine 5'-phosphate oxidase superfamily)
MPNIIEEMSSEEIERFLTCSRVGRIGISYKGQTYIFPLGYVYSDSKIFFHSCNKGLKMEGIRENPNVCFEVDESTSDSSMYKSIMIFGTAKIISDKEKMIPYLQQLINKYRVPLTFESYMIKNKLNVEQELKETRICVIEPKKITSRKFVKEK